MAEESKASFSSAAVPNVASSNSNPSLTAPPVGHEDIKVVALDDGLWSIQGFTKVVASCTHAAKAKQGSHTVYTVDVKVFFDDELGRHWQVLRRYSDFHKLHKALKDLGFPCPELPPKQLWFHTNAFIAERRNALNLWIQGTLCIWQSVAPTVPATAYAVGEMLESFLCDVDTERFTSSIEGLSGGAFGNSSSEATTLHDFGLVSPTSSSAAPGTTLPTNGSGGAYDLVGGNNNNSSSSSFASLARAWRVSSKHPQGIPPTIEEGQASSPRALHRRTKSSDDAGGSTAITLPSASSSSAALASQNDLQMTRTGLERSILSPRDTSTISGLSSSTLSALPGDSSAVGGGGIPSAGTSGKSSRGSGVFRAQSLDDLASLSRQTSELMVRADDVGSGNQGGQDVTKNLSRSLPHTGVPSSLQQHHLNVPGFPIMASGDVGVAVDLRSVKGSTPAERKYSTFDREGRKVIHSFRPFTATVLYSDEAEPTTIAGPPDACTPVSVPPTPHGQGEFFQSWSQYTNSVLDFVAARLDKVSRRTNILDDVDGGAATSPAGSLEESSLHDRSRTRNNNTLGSSAGAAGAVAASAQGSTAANRGAGSPSHAGAMGGSVAATGISLGNRRSGSPGKAAEGTRGSGAASQHEDDDDLLLDDTLNDGSRLDDSPMAGPATTPNGTFTHSSGSVSNPAYDVASGRTSLEEARYRSYLNAGERLVNIILRESESAIDPIGSDWEFVANTKNVIVMKRRKPIRRRHLKGSGGGGGGRESAGGAATTPGMAASSGLDSISKTVPPSPESASTVPSALSSLAPSRGALSGLNGYETAQLHGGDTVPSSTTAHTNAPAAAAPPSSSSSRQYCFMGRGVINAPAAEIFQVVRRPQARHSYDRMLKEEVILENVQTMHGKNGAVGFVKLASDAGPGDAHGSLAILSEAHFVPASSAPVSPHHTGAGANAAATGVANPVVAAAAAILANSAAAASSTGEGFNNISAETSSTTTTTNNAMKREGSTSSELQHSNSTSTSKKVPTHTSSTLEGLTKSDIPDDDLNLANIDNSPIGDLLVYYHLFETNRCFLRYSRDFCVLQYAKGPVAGKPSKYIVVGASVNHIDCPSREDVVRATLPIFGWVIEPVSRHQSKVSYIMQLDFGGSVPSQLLNTISFRQPLCVHYLGKFMAELRASKEAQKALLQEAAAKEKSRPTSPNTLIGSGMTTVPVIATGASGPSGNASGTTPSLSAAT